MVSSEFEVPDQLDTDCFANIFAQEEEQLALKKMLNELTKQNNSENK